MMDNESIRVKLVKLVGRLLQKAQAKSGCGNDNNGHSNRCRTNNNYKK